MNTKYGQLPDEILLAYVEGMIGKVYKMLPMKEKGIETLPKYIESTLREFIGEKQLVNELKNNADFLAVLGIVENLLSQNDIPIFRSDILKTINLIERLKSSLGGDK